jgi:hypothetical protein
MTLGRWANFRAVAATALAFMAVFVTTVARGEGLARELLAFLGISATPSQMKGPNDDGAAGDLWVVNLRSNARQQLTQDGCCRWPVFDPAGDRVLALSGDTLVGVSLGDGSYRLVHEIPSIVKLVGFDRGSADRLLILHEVTPSQIEIGVLSLSTGQIANIPYDRSSPVDRLILAHLRGEERVYDNVRLYPKKEMGLNITGSPVEWTDVYLKQGQTPARNISACAGADCGQPSLSSDGTKVVFIKNSR